MYVENFEAILPALDLWSIAPFAPTALSWSAPLADPFSRLNHQQAENNRDDCGNHIESDIPNIEDPVGKQSLDHFIHQSKERGGPDGDERDVRHFPVILISFFQGLEDKRG